MRELIIVGRYWLAIKLLSWVIVLLEKNNAPIILAYQIAAITEVIADQVELVKRDFDRKMNDA